jgi:hypothetical protein
MLTNPLCPSVAEPIKRQLFGTLDIRLFSKNRHDVDDLRVIELLNLQQTQGT